MEFGTDEERFKDRGTIKTEVRNPRSEIGKEPLDDAPEK